MFDQLKKWLSGDADWKSEQRLDQLGKNDAFLKDAMDGYRSMPEADHSKTIAGLKGQLKGKYAKNSSVKKGMYFNWTSIAAAAAMIGVIGLFFWTQRELPDSGAIAETTQSRETKTKDKVNAMVAPAETKSLELENTEEPNSGFVDKLEEKEETTIGYNAKKQSTIKPQLDPSNIEAGIIEEADLTSTGNNEFDLDDTYEEDALAGVPTIEDSKTVIVDIGINPEVTTAPPPVIVTEEAASYSSVEVPENEPAGGAVDKELAEAKDELAKPESFIESSKKVERSMSTDVAATVYSPTGLKGTVIDLGSGEVMIGVSLYIKGTDSGTTTDFDGNYFLQSDEPLPWTVIVSYTGYMDQEFEINSLAEDFSISLDEGGVELSEVVVTGYGIEKAKKKSRSKSDTSSNVKPVGGFKKMKRYINKNLKYPELAKQNKIQGGVTIRFFIGEDGTPEAFSILNTIGSGCDQEAKRLLEEGPKWKPTGVWAIYTVVFNL